MEFIVKTSFGLHFKVTGEQIAADYASTAIQFEDNKESWEDLYIKILKDDGWLLEWYNDYLHRDIQWYIDRCEIVYVDEYKKAEFFNWTAIEFGEVLE